MEIADVMCLPAVDFRTMAANSPDPAVRERGERYFRAMVGREALEHGVRFSVEPHAGSVCADPRDVAALCEMAPELELTLDYSHFIVGGFDAADVEPLLSRARHVHARGATRDRLQASFRSNVIDYDRVVDALSKRGYEGFIAVEYMWIEWAHLNEVDVVSETVVMRDALRARIAGEPWRYPDPGGVHEAPIEVAQPMEGRAR
jgi:sugar phosphate isomerase/epimerase